MARKAVAGDLDRDGFFPVLVAGYNDYIRVGEVGESSVTVAISTREDLTKRGRC